LDRITSDYNRYNNLYKSHSITKQQYEQALAAKLETEVKYVFRAATKSKRVSKNQLLLPNQKFQVSKPKLLPILKSKGATGCRKIKSYLHRCNCCN
jgi:hypothetical protein